MKATKDTISNQTAKGIPLPQAPVTRRTWWLMIVAQMEQTIINVLTISVGALLPMMKLYFIHSTGAEPGVFLQGAIGAAALCGISIGSPIFGTLGDRLGYLQLFRLCGWLILLGGLGGWLIDGSPWITVASLFVIGLGIGGGYALDDLYLSELMPKKERSRMIGIAKTIAAFGTCWGGFAVFGVLRLLPSTAFWRYAMIVVAALGLLTVLMRIRWWESPRWLLLHGRYQEALHAAEMFMGSGIIPSQIALQNQPQQKVSIGDLFKGKAIWKVIATSIPWALEGIGAFGMGTFLPIILMSLGLHLGSPDTIGIPRIEDSVLLSSSINIFMTVGFLIGLILLNRVYHINLMASGFYICAASILFVIGANIFHWPLWMGILGFAIFETALCAGPGIVTFLLPTEVYTVAERGSGAGIAASVGKLGGVFGVFMMPVLINGVGIVGTLIFCTAVMLLGGIITNISGSKALPKPTK